MRDVFIFDVDGTLTPAREKINPYFSDFLLNFMKHHETYLASGSDLDKLKQQLPKEAFEASSGIFTCMGNVYYCNGKQQYKRSFEAPEGLIEDLVSILNESPYVYKFGNHIEKRIGMINFSVVGRNANSEQRKQYHKYDEEKNEREKIASLLNSKYAGQIVAAVGGEISIDIYNPGRDKSQVLTELVKCGNIRRNDCIHFYGDKIFPGGNDHALGQALEKSGYNCRIVRVNTWIDTWKRLFLTHYSIVK